LLWCFADVFEQKRGSSASGEADDGDGFSTMFEKGQSKLYKVIDSSDVVVQVASPFSLDVLVSMFLQWCACVCFN